MAGVKGSRHCCMGRMGGSRSLLYRDIDGTPIRHHREMSWGRRVMGRRNASSGCIFAFRYCCRILDTRMGGVSHC
jgi:hypothetical protein